MVVSRLSQHVEAHDLYEPSQSAYRKGHSVETALVRIQNDLLHAADRHCVSCLVLLDLSAAFDTVDHSILLRCLSRQIGLHGVALDWFASYLTAANPVGQGEWHQEVSKKGLGGVMSQALTLHCGVPQGSVLGPTLFTVYTASEIGQIIRQHDLDFYLYADDSQLKTSFCIPDSLASIHQLEACIDEVDTWMVTNRWRLYNGTTDILFTGTPTLLHEIPVSTIRIGDADIVPSDVVCSLGVMFDSALTMEPQISAICRSCRLHIHNIGKIVRYLTPRATELLVHVFIMLCLDSCNALLHSLPDDQVRHLQLIQNTAARLVTRSCKHEHITPVLRHLHWLPVHEQIDYKILLLAFKGLHGLAPRYLAELLVQNWLHKALRSTSANKLVIPRTFLKT